MPPDFSSSRRGPFYCFPSQIKNLDTLPNRLWSELGWICPGRKKMKSILALLAVWPVFAQTTVTYSYNGLPLPIFGDAADATSLANVFVPRTIKITKVTAQVQIQYPNSGDLKLYLFSPSGTRTILLEHDCGVANIDTTFDDSAPSQWKDFCPSEAGRGPFRADQPLSNFNSNDSSFGTWVLAVENDESDS